MAEAARPSWFPAGYDNSVFSPSGPPPIPFGVSDSNPTLMSPAPSQMGPLDSSFDNAQRYQSFTNDRCHLTYAALINQNEDSEELDLCHNTLLFSYVDKQLKAVDRNFVHLRNLSMLNCYLASQAGRAEFGKSSTCAKLLAKWHPIGFQQTNTDAPGVTRRLREMAVTVAVSHKCRIPNLWLALGKPMNVGDHLYLVLRRYKHYALRPGDGVKVFQGEYFWRFEPYISYDRRPPPAVLFTSPHTASTPAPQKITVVVPPKRKAGGADPRDAVDEGTLGQFKAKDEWFGTHLYIGLISEFYGDHSPQRFQSAAKRALFPQQRNSEFKDILVALPVVEIMYLVH